MSIHRHRMRFEADVDTVYALVSNPVGWAEWMPAIDAVEPHHPAVPGATFMLHGSFAEGPQDIQVVVTHLHPPYDAFFHMSGRLDATVSFHVAALGDESEVEVTVNTHPETSAERALEVRIAEQIGDRVLLLFSGLEEHLRRAA